MTKLTNRVALDAAIHALSVYTGPDFHYAGDETEFSPKEIIDKLNTMIVQLDKKNTSPKKPTATQIGNTILAENIANEMEPNVDYTISDMVKQFSCCNLLSNQKVSSVVHQMVDSGVVVNTVVKGRSYFRLAGEV